MGNSMGFSEGLKREAEGFEPLQAFSCPPVPASTKVSTEGRANYQTLQNNNEGVYGLTGLMAVKLGPGTVRRRRLSTT